MGEVMNAYLVINNFCIKEKINPEEFFKLLAVSNSTISIPNSRLMDKGLVEFSADNKKLILTKKGQIIVDKAKGVFIDNTNNDQYLPKLSAESAVFVKTLAQHLLKNKATKENLEKLQKYCKNPLSLPFFLLFLELFPTSDKAKNKDWEMLFGAEYQGVTLRKVSEGTAKKFEKIIKTKDIGIFLAGTYQHILESYNKEKQQYYPKAIENYFKEWEHWYENSNMHFKKQVSNNTTNNMTSL